MSMLASLDSFLFITPWEYMYFRDMDNFYVTGTLRSQAI